MTLPATTVLPDSTIRIVLVAGEGVALLGLPGDFDPPSPWATGVVRGDETLDGTPNSQRGRP